MRLEPTDTLVLRELIGWTGGGFPKGALNLTTRTLSERTGLHRNTVQRRLRALRDGGVLEGFIFEPRPAWLGLVRAGHLFEDVAVRDAAHLLAVLEPFPFVSIAALHAETCFLHTWHATEETMRADVDAVRAALGASSASASFMSSRMPAHPSDALAVTPLDRRLLLAMRRGYDRSITRAAATVGVSRRTAARRVQRLAAAEAGALLPVLRPSRIEGTVFAVYEGGANTDEAQAALRETFPERVMGPMGGGVRSMVMAPLSSYDEAARRFAIAQALPGLGSLRMYLMRDWVFPQACDAWLAERVQNAPPGVANV